MTPAESLASAKTWKRDPRNSVYPGRAVWECNIRELRESLRISIREVARAVNLSTSSLWKIEMGGDVMLTTAKKLATFFGRTIEELWPKRGKVKR